MRYGIAAGLVCGAARVAAADPSAAPAHGVAIEAPVPPESWLVIGAHVGFSRVVVSTDTNDAAGYGPWLDFEAGAKVSARTVVVGMVAFARDSASYTDPTTLVSDASTYTHLAAGTRVQVDIAPHVWLGGGLAYMHEADAFDRTHPGDAAVIGTKVHSSPMLELRVGLDAARLGSLRWQLVASGAVFQPDSSGYFSTVAMLAAGAQWR